jgi:hypothetical protein
MLPAVSTNSLNSPHDNAVGLGARIEFHQLAASAGSARDGRFAWELGGKGSRHMLGQMKTHKLMLSVMDTRKGMDWMEEASEWEMLH